MKFRIIIILSLFWMGLSFPKTYNNDVKYFTKLDPQKISTQIIHYDKNFRFGITGNMWHPVGVLVNYEFSNFGIYGTFKSNAEIKRKPMFNQFNITGGISVRAFQNTSELCLGFSYNTLPAKRIYFKGQYRIGVELLWITQFPDRNWNLLFGWNSNVVDWRTGLTAGFLYQFHIGE